MICAHRQQRPIVKWARWMSISYFHLHGQQGKENSFTLHDIQQEGGIMRSFPQRLHILLKHIVVVVENKRSYFTHEIKTVYEQERGFSAPPLLHEQVFLTLLSDRQHAALLSLSSKCLTLFFFGRSTDYKCSCGRPVCLEWTQIWPMLNQWEQLKGCIGALHCPCSPCHPEVTELSFMRGGGGGVGGGVWVY